MGSMTSLATNLGTAAVIFLGVAAMAFALRHLALRRWASLTASPFSEVLIESFRIPSLMWCLLIGLYTAIDTAELPQRPSATVLKLLFSLLVISVTVAIANVGNGPSGWVETELSRHAGHWPIADVRQGGDLDHRWSRPPGRTRYLDYARAHGARGSVVLPSL